jgi:serine/threonine-protein kinase RsbW
MTKSSKSVQIVVPATLVALHQVSDGIEKYLAMFDGLPDSKNFTYNVVLAVHELCANIVTHAYAGEPGVIGVGLLMKQRPPSLIVSVYDNAPRIFDEAGWKSPNLDDPPEHGLGIWLIKQLMDEVIYSPAPGNNRWCLVKHIPGLVAGGKIGVVH